MDDKGSESSEDGVKVDLEGNQNDQPSTHRRRRFKLALVAAVVLLSTAGYLFWPTRARIIDAQDSGGWISVGAAFNFFTNGTFRYREYGVMEVVEGVWRLSGLKLHIECVQKVNEMAGRKMRLYEYRPSYLIMLGPNKIHFFDGNLTLRRVPAYWYDDRPWNAEPPVRADYWPEAPRKPIPFFQAVRSNDLGRVKKLVTNNPTLVNQRGYDGITGVYQAVFQGDLEMVRFLLAQGAPANATNNHGLPAISTAIMHHPEAEARAIVDSLLEYGADVNMRDNVGATPLHAASRKGYPSVIRTLLDHGGNPSIKTDEGQTARDFAKRFEKPEVISLLE